MNYKFLMFFTLQLAANTDKAYDEEDKNEALTREENFLRLLQEHKEKGYIVYSKENMEILEKGDKNEGIPFFIFIITNNNQNCKPFKEGPLIKDLYEALNNKFITYKDIVNNNATGSILLCILIELEAIEYDPPLQKILNTLPKVETTPMLMLLCRRSNCPQENCKKNQKKHLRFIQKYMGITYPLKNWKDKMILDLLHPIELHGFKK